MTVLRIAYNSIEKSRPRFNTREQIWIAKTGRRKGMSLERVASISDLRALAKRNVPRVVFDLLDGAAQDELVLKNSVERFREHSFVPRVLLGASKRDQATTLFGKTYSSF